MTTQVVRSRGIYHGLPVYPADTPSQVAIVTGANGISGYFMTKILGNAPERWSKVYCLSRRPPDIPGGLPENAEFVQCDFLTSAEEIGGLLQSKGIKHVDHVFFFAYVEPTAKPGERKWSDYDEFIRLNRGILNNFLGALTYLSISPKRIMLQTGAKNYAVHNGLVKQPMEESEPRPTVEPNFYFAQEDALAAWCATQPSTRYTIAMPSIIIGAVPNAANNLFYPITVYCHLCRYLGEPLVFPAGFDSWTTLSMNSMSKMNAYMSEWLALGLPDPETARETGVGTGGGATGENTTRPSARSEGQGKFNAVDGTLFSWEDTWPRLAEWFGVPYVGPDTSDRPDQGTITLSNAPRGYGPSRDIHIRVSTTEWGKSEKVRTAWRELAGKYHLRMKELPQDFFMAVDVGCGGVYPLAFSTIKARKCGWHGVVDTNEGIYEAMREMGEVGMVPPMPDGRAVFA